MNSRYEIQDIIAQDESGVVFHAEDRETGREVVVRRFFPFGVEGGGLEEEERIAYEIAVRRLMSVSHSALRNVIDGGTDPVDGMPFIVTEWIGGQPLSERLQERPLSPSSAKALADIALETCQILSETFQEESVWIETSTDSIILGPSDQDRQVTFWISPLRWLGEANARQGLRPILQLTEEVTGWNRRMLSESAGEGLGAWIKALRKDADQWTLEQARHALHHGVQSLTEPRRPTVSLDPQPISPAHATIPSQTAPPPPIQFRDKTNWWPWIVACTFTVLSIAFVFWQANRTQIAPAAPTTVVAHAEASPSQPAAPMAPEPRTMSSAEAAEAASARAAERMAELAKIRSTPQAPGTSAVPDALNQQLIEVGQSMRAKIGTTVGIEAKIHEVRSSESGKTIYLEFGTTRKPDAICARYRTSLGFFTEAQLRKHIGKAVKIQGKVVADSSGRIAVDIGGKGGLTVK